MIKKILRIEAGHEKLMIYYNTKKPWWKTTGMIWFVLPHNELFFESPEGEGLDIDKLYYRVGDEGDLYPLKDYEGFKVL